MLNNGRGKYEVLHILITLRQKWEDAKDAAEMAHQDSKLPLHASHVALSS
jgi:hypothetical protein